MINFIDNGFMFFGNGRENINTFKVLANAAMFYYNYYTTEEPQGYLPELIFLELSQCSFLGDRFQRIKWHPLAALSHHKSVLDYERVYKEYTILDVGMDNNRICKIACKRDNFVAGDRLQIIDHTLNTPFNVRYKTAYDFLTCVPVQLRVIEATHIDEVSYLKVESGGAINRPLLTEIDKFCCIGSFSAGGICAVNGGNPMLLAYPFEYI